MSNSNPKNRQNHNPKPRKKNDPRYVRVVVGHRLVPMQAHHVDEIADREGRTDHRTGWWNDLTAGPRCSKCFRRLPEGQKGHFCRWDFKQEGPRETTLKMRQVPVYRWVLREEARSKAQS